MWRILAIGLLLGLVGLPGQAQPQENKPKHVVSIDELNQDAARPAQTRQANEAAVHDLFTSEAGQKALQSAKIDYKRVDTAISQLSDEDLAKVATQSRQAEKDFAGGFVSDRFLIVIILIAVLIIALALVF
jgi:hypothetical protein